MRRATRISHDHTSVNSFNASDPSKDSGSICSQLFSRREGGEKHVLDCSKKGKPKRDRLHDSALSILNRRTKSVSPFILPLPFFQKIAISGPENDTPNGVIGSSSSAEQPAEPPKPPRSAFMCYTDSMKEQLMFDSLGNKEEQLKIVASKWKMLSDRQRAEWEEVSRQDKVRYVMQSLCCSPLPLTSLTTHVW